MRELVAEAEADHDLMLRVTVLFILPHVLAYCGDETAARAAAEGAIESAAELGDLYIGMQSTSRRCIVAPRRG